MPSSPRRAALAALGLALGGATAARAQPSAPGATTRIGGSVYDSVAQAPLRGAEVRLVSAERPADVPAAAVTDSLGRFTLGAFPAGRYVASFWHPRLDSLLIEPPSYLVTVRDAKPVALALAMPSAATLRVGYCGARPPADSLGVLLGYLRASADRAPIDGGTVTARWLEISFGRGARGVERQVVERHAQSTASGWFVLCDVPTGAGVTLRASRGADTTGTILLDLPTAGVARHDFYLGPSARATVTVAPPADAAGVTDSAGRPLAARDLTATVRRGAGRLAGTVRGTHGAPLPGARVSIAGSDAAAVSDERGRFSLGDAPEGTQTLSARAIGYFPVDLPVDVFADEGPAIAIELASVRSVLDTIRVVGRRVYSSRVAAFEARRRARVGQFLDSTAIERMSALVVTDLVRRAASMTIVPVFDRQAGRVVDRLRVRGGGSCLPIVYVDGIPIRIDTDLREIDHLVRPADILGMELYTAGQAPPDLTQLGACATIAVTTRW